MDEFKGTQSITAPSGRFYAVVPHDTNELAYSTYKVEAQKVFGEFVRPVPYLKE